MTNKKVLVVDDTKNIRALLTTCLELKGYSVFTANNGIVAMELVMEQSFDIAFIDIKMPEVSGTEVLRRIRAIGLNFPVVIMTAFATVRNAVECTKLGAVAYLQKPFTVDKVNDVLLMLENINSIEDNIEVYIKKSRELINKQNYDEAYNHLKRGLSIDPSCGEVYFLIGLVNEKNNNLQQAEKFYTVSREFGYISSL